MLPKSISEIPTFALYLFLFFIQRFVSPSISYLKSLYFGRHSYTNPKSKPTPKLELNLLSKPFSIRSGRLSEYP